MKNTMKAYIFHQKKYITDCIARALGFDSDDNYKAFHTAKEISSIIEQIDKDSDKSSSLLIVVADYQEDIKIIADEVFGTRLNRTPFIILSFGNAQSISMMFPEEFIAHDGNLKSNLIDVGQLPCLLLSDIKPKIETLNNKYLANTKECKEIWQSIGKRLASEQDISQRHRLRNAMAAGRILNGAILSGDYNILDCNEEKRLRDLYFRLIENSDIPDKDTEKRNVEETIRRAKNHIRADDTKSTKETWNKDLTKVLVIDDQVEIWEPVWQYILGTKVELAVDGKIGLEKIKEDKFDCVLLDVALGSDKENGIEVLQRIKHEHFDLPVIMMTACDNAELTKKCLRYGADTYFVKELRQARDSVNYYRYIRDMIIKASNVSEEREIWEEFIEIEDAISSLDKKCKTEIGKYFRKAYYLLTIDEEHLLPSKLLIPEWLTVSRTQSAKYDGVVYNALISADQCFIASLMSNERKTYQEAMECLDAKTTAGIYPSFRDKVMRVFKQVDRSYYDNLSDAAEVRHPHRTTGSTPTTKAKAIGCMRNLLKVIMKSSINSSASQKTSFTPESIDLKEYLENSASSFESHEDLSKSGAMSFIRGFDKVHGSSAGNAVGNPTDDKKIAFIDDEGGLSDWAIPLTSYFRFKGIALDIFASYDELKSKSDLKVYSLILLDLVYKKNHEMGIEILDAIKKDYIAIPVVMLTADNSAFYARKCLLHGADDYFVKQPFAAGKEDRYFKSFEKTIKKYLDPIKKTNRENWWELISQVSTNTWGLSTTCIELLKSSKSIGKKTPDSDIIEGERRLIAAPLREGLFYYLMSLNSKNLVDDWRVNRLLVNLNRPGADDVYICFGQLVEYLVSILAIVQEHKPWQRIELLIDELQYPYYLKSFFKLLWKLRTQSKMSDVDSAAIDLIISVLRLVLFDFKLFVKTDPEVAQIEQKYNKELARNLQRNDVVKGMVINVSSSGKVQYVIGLSPICFEGILRSTKSYKVNVLHTFVIDRVEARDRKPNEMIVVLIER